MKVKRNLSLARCVIGMLELTLKLCQTCKHNLKLGSLSVTLMFFSAVSSITDCDKRERERVDLTNFFSAYTQGLKWFKQKFLLMGMNGMQFP